MPPYGQAARSIYPGQNELAIGYRKISDGPAALQSTQLEVVATGYKSIPVCVAPAPDSHPTTSRQISWQVTYGTEPAAINLILQGSIDDVDDEYQQVDTSTTLGIFTQTVASNFRFFRLLASSVTGACTLAVKLTAM